MSAIFQSSGLGMEVAPYDYQPTDGTQEKRTVPKPGFDHLIPPAKRVKASQGGDEVPNWINYAHLATEEELARERMARRTVVEELARERVARRTVIAELARECIRKLLMIVFQNKQTFISNGVAYQQAVAKHKGGDDTIKQLKDTASQKDSELDRQRIIHQQAVASHADCDRIIERLKAAASQKISELDGRCTFYQQAVTHAENENSTLQEQAGQELGRLQNELQQLQSACREAEIKHKQLLLINAEIQKKNQELTSLLTPDASAEMEGNELRQAELQAVWSQNADLLAENERLHVLEQWKESEWALCYKANQNLAGENANYAEDYANVVRENGILRGMQMGGLSGPANLALLPPALPTPPEEQTTTDMLAPNSEQQAESSTAAEQAGGKAKASGTPSQSLSKKKNTEPQNIRDYGRKAGGHKDDEARNTRTGALTQSSGIDKPKRTPASGGVTKAGRKKIDDDVSELSPLRKRAKEAATASPEPKDGNDEGTEDMSTFALAGYLYNSGQHRQIIRKNMFGGFITSDDGTMAIWFQKRDNNKVFRAEVTIIDMASGQRKRFLEDPGHNLDNGQRHFYKVMCILAQLPEVQMEAAKKVFKEDNKRDRIFQSGMRREYGTASVSDEKSRHPVEWEDTVNSLAGSNAFACACTAWVAKERTTVTGAGPWPAKFTDPQIRHDTSLNPELDVPEFDKDYSNPLDDASTGDLSKKLDDEGTIDPVQALMDRMARRTDLAPGGGEAS
ncbi:hypothetical protein LTR85_006772 [Meristemomyces frigidus]|nr:hypothetical protein LTR85_006772 [Meristemomyces frigidus]